MLLSVICKSLIDNNNRFQRLDRPDGARHVSASRRTASLPHNRRNMGSCARSLDGQRGGVFGHTSSAMARASDLVRSSVVRPSDLSRSATRPATTRSRRGRAHAVSSQLPAAAFRPSGARAGRTILRAAHQDEPPSDGVRMPAARRRSAIDPLSRVGLAMPPAFHGRAFVRSRRSVARKSRTSRRPTRAIACVPGRCCA